MPELIRDQIGLMVNDVIETTLGNIAEAGIETVEDVRAAGRMLGGFSPELAEAERRWKSFMYTTLYHHPRQRDASEAAQKIVNDLFIRSEEHTSELKSIMRISYAVLCLKKKKT